MPANTEEIKKREVAARAAIKGAPKPPAQIFAAYATFEIVELANDVHAELHRWIGEQLLIPVKQQQSSVGTVDASKNPVDYDWLMSHSRLRFPRCRLSRVYHNGEAGFFNAASGI